MISEFKNGLDGKTIEEIFKAKSECRGYLTSEANTYSVEDTFKHLWLFPKDPLRESVIKQARACVDKHLAQVHEEYANSLEGFRVSIYTSQANICTRLHYDLPFDTFFGFIPLTCIAYLNEGFLGGELIFPIQGKVIVPEIGKVVVFPNFYPFMHTVNSSTESRHMARISFKIINPDNCPFFSIKEKRISELNPMFHT